jgi:hypothetical protein
VLLSALLSAAARCFGYQCAGLALLVPWTDVGKSILGKSPFAYVAILFSGLIIVVLLKQSAPAVFAAVWHIAG